MTNKRSTPGSHCSGRRRHASHLRSNSVLTGTYVGAIPQPLKLCLDRVLEADRLSWGSWHYERRG